MIMLLYGFIMLSENGFIIRDLSLITGKGAASTTRYRVCVCVGGGGGRGATPHHLTLDVCAQIGGKWVLFGPGGRETVYCYMGIFLGFTPVWVCFYRVNIHMGVFLEGFHPYKSLEMGYCEPLEAILPTAGQMAFCDFSPNFQY